MFVIFLLSEKSTRITIAQTESKYSFIHNQSREAIKLNNSK